jgi:hypothetical protein
MFTDSMTLLMDLPKRKKWRARQLSSNDPTGGNLDYLPAPPHEVVRIGEIKGPGCVQRMWFTILSQDPDAYRNLILRFYWDGEDKPSVEAPFGDFFGMGFSEYAQYSSAVQGVTSGGFWSYWPMPFTKGAVFEAKNIGDTPITDLYFGIQYSDVDFGLETPRFHAKWRRENPTTIDQNYTILRAKGAGHYCGVAMNMQSYDKGSRLFLEGDEMIWVDGEEEPSIKGTGTEDYFQGGWYWINGPFSAPYHGLTYMDLLHCRFSVYRLHLPDPVPFEREIDVTIEHGSGNMLQEDYSSTAYWYQIEPHDRSFGGIGDDVSYVKPLGTRWEAHLISELVQDPPVNVKRRRVLQDAAKLRVMLREAKIRGDIPPELADLDQDDFLRADYKMLKDIVDRHKKLLK